MTTRHGHRLGRFQDDPKRFMGEEDTMIGPGGVVARPRSESGVLGTSIFRLRNVLSGRMGDKAHRELERVIADLLALQEQVREGYHKNPQLVVFGNPPMTARRFGGIQGARIEVVGEISHDTHAITYKHAKDRKPYEHEFENPTSLLAVKVNGRPCVLITSPDGFPIWQDF